MGDGSVVNEVDRETTSYPGTPSSTDEAAASHSGSSDAKPSRDDADKRSFLRRFAIPLTLIGTFLVGLLTVVDVANNLLSGLIGEWVTETTGQAESKPVTLDWFLKSTTAEVDRDADNFELALLEDHRALRQGDEVRFETVSADPGYVMLLVQGTSLGKGGDYVDLIVPNRRTNPDAVAIPAGRADVRIPVEAGEPEPFGIYVDDARERVRVLAIYSNMPFRLHPDDQHRQTTASLEDEIERKGVGTIRLASSAMSNDVVMFDQADVLAELISDRPISTKPVNEADRTWRLATVTFDTNARATK